MKPNLTLKPRLQCSNWAICMKLAGACPLTSTARYYRYAGRLGTFAPDIAQQASKSAADLLDRMRESEEDATSGQSPDTAGQTTALDRPLGKLIN